jgi:CheY-like chemotaxis protein
MILRDLGYEVENAADGAQAIAHFTHAKNRGKPFDVVLLDLTVRAGMGGLETLEKLRAIDPTVCAIATSGYAPDPVLGNPQKYGFAGSLPKPYRREDLALLIQRACQHKLKRG